MPVAFGAPGADGHLVLAGRGAPVDGAGVVAGDVVAEAVELGALAAGQDAGTAVEFAQAGQPGREVLAAGEGRQDPDGPGGRLGALAGPQAQGAVGADRDAVGLAVAAAGGQQPGGQPAAFARGDDQLVAGRGGLRAREPAARGPGVPDAGPELAAAGVGDGEVDVRRFAEADRGVSGAGQHEAAYGRREGAVERAGQCDRAVDREHAGPARFEEADRDAAEGRQQGGASGEGHQRGTGTWERIAVITASAVTPSISASGRSWTRWRRVGRERALTSSGVT